MSWLRSSALVFSADVADSLMVLLRNVILARLLSVEDFGIAATFSILLTLIDASQTAGLNRMIVQSSETGERKLLDGVHGVQMLMGLVTAALVLVAAWPFAAAMGTSTLTWAYILMAIVPAVRAFCNLESYRQQRQGKFGPTIARQLIPQATGLALIWPAYKLLGDYRVMLVVIVAQQIALLLVTNLFSSQPFRVGFHREITAQAMRFGWPLFVNGLLMFFVGNGDRMIVSNRFGLVSLGWFSLAYMLTFMPTTMIARSLQTLALPAMAKMQHDLARLQQKNDLLVSFTTVISVGLVGSMAILGELILVHIFGEKFRAAEPFLILLAIMQGIRLSRAVPALTAMATAETKNPLYTNIVRAIAIPFALAIAIITGNIYWMLLAGIAGEVVSALVAGWLAQKMVGVGSRHYAVCLFAAVQFNCMIGAVSLAHWNPLLLVPSLVLLLIPIRGFWFHARDLLQR